MINGGPDPLFVKAMVVPSRETVVRFSPVDFTVLPPGYTITSAAKATRAKIATAIIRFMDPPVPSLAFRATALLYVVPAEAILGR
jgi:hypothetical protein